MTAPSLLHAPALDPGFLPAAVWHREYRERLRRAGNARPLVLALEQGNGTTSIFATEIFPSEENFAPLNRRYVERLFKFLLWQRGGCRITVAGAPEIAAWLASVYHPDGERAFDHQFVGEQIYRQGLEIRGGELDDLPPPHEPPIPLGRHLHGCRVGFDLGGTVRKCAAMIDGVVVFSEGVPWNPCFTTDPAYHRAEIADSLRRAAARLPRVDAIGGSAAGVYVGNEVRVASLFCRVASDDFERHVRRMFVDLAHEWNDVPFAVANDGEVAALAGAMALNVHSLLGVSLGTSQAAGYVDASGRVRPWLNELCFAPVDHRPDAPVDRWSGDAGCGVQYFSQQAFSRLLPAAGIAVDADATDAECLANVQSLVEADDPRGGAVFETLGAYLGYAVAHYAEFYELEHVRLTGGVTSGEGGRTMVDKARRVLEDEFPVLAGRVRLHLAAEKEKSHGQAVAAATLPELPATL